MTRGRSDTRRSALFKHLRVLLSQSFSARRDCSDQISEILQAQTCLVAVSCLRGNHRDVFSSCLRASGPAAGGGEGGGFRGSVGPATHEMFFIAVSHSWLLSGWQIKASGGLYSPCPPGGAHHSEVSSEHVSCLSRVSTFHLADVCKILKTSGSTCSPLFVVYYLFHFHSCVSLNNMTHMTQIKRIRRSC